MSKELLTPLEISKQLEDFVLEFVKNGLDRRFVIGSFIIIETALKDYDAQAKVIETLKNTISLGYTPPKVSVDNDKLDYIGSISLKLTEELNKERTELIRNWILRTCFPKELKALEIIKNYDLPLFWLEKYPTYEEYYKYCRYEQFMANSDIPLREEYELLKEVLKCWKY